jgi:hypothetical protein
LVSAREMDGANTFGLGGSLGGAADGNSAPRNCDGRAHSPARAAVCAPSPPKRRAAIAAQLRAAGIECSIRRSRGADICSACGQLKGAMG